MQELSLPQFHGSDLVPLLVGAALIFFGRKLFWLAVAGIGFLVGIEVARRIPGLETELTELLVALAFGVVGLVIAIVAQKLAVGLGGLLLGGYATWWLLSSMNHGLPELGVVAFIVVGAILGVALGAALFELALVLLSSLAGALLIADVIRLDPPFHLGLVILLTALGFWAQGRTPRRRRR